MIKRNVWKVKLTDSLPKQNYYSNLLHKILKPSKLQKIRHHLFGGEKGSSSSKSDEALLAAA